MNNLKPQETILCRFLRAKNSFGMLESGESWSGIEDPNATFWCVKTSGPIGPDNKVVNAKQCIAKRMCHQAG